MSLDTKYRPKNYDDVLGQSNTIKTLKGFVKNDAGWKQSYLFAGAFGSGKTTLGRILARALLCENTIDPRYLIKFTNDVFKYTSFNDVPNIVMSISWGNILNWIELNKRSDRILNLNIEFHYYDENFMPGPVKYVFQYYIC